MLVFDGTIRLNGIKPEKVNWCFMSASQIGQNGRGKLIAVDKATEENCRSCDPDHDRKIHNGECPCCEVIFRFLKVLYHQLHLIFQVLKSGSFKSPTYYKFIKTLT